nr:beta-mannosidase [Tanacetum cinerariifolium]
MAGSQTTGDMHYWDVWGGTAPISDYEKQVPRFMSEYGFQSFPELKSVQQFTVPGDQDIASPVMKEHQRSAVGNPRLKEYLLRDYKEPKDFASFLYVSQVLQAQAIKLSAEHLRRSRPRTMGSMYWQLDDCWGVASWSSIDYYGRWKALQYYAKRFYAPVLVSPHEEGDNVRLYVVSDRTTAIPASLQQANDSTYQVTLKSKTLAREVNLSLAQGDGFFGDNYFDLLPGETKTLTFTAAGATSL